MKKSIDEGPFDGGSASNFSFCLDNCNHAFVTEDKSSLFSPLFGCMSKKALKGCLFTPLCNVENMCLSDETSPELKKVGEGRRVYLL